MTDPREIEALALRIGSAAADWNRYLNSTRGYDPMAPVQSVTDALDTADTALRALATQLTAARAVLEIIADYGWADDGKMTFTVNVGSREDARALAAQLDATIDAAKGVRDAKS